MFRREEDFAIEILYDALHVVALHRSHRDRAGQMAHVVREASLVVTDGDQATGAALGKPTLDPFGDRLGGLGSQCPRAIVRTVGDRARQPPLRARDVVLEDLSLFFRPPSSSRPSPRGAFAAPAPLLRVVRMA